jgi:hypothetical protein
MPQTNATPAERGEESHRFGVLMNEYSFNTSAGPMATIGNLREIARRCRRGEPLNQPLQHWLGASLDQFLLRRCPTIEDAFGLRAPRGGVPWWLEEAIRRRDAALRELAARFFAEASIAARAKHIHLLAVRYGASAWRFDRERDESPARYGGTPGEWLWRAFKSGAPMPICERQLRSILAHRGPLPGPAASHPAR